MTQLLTTYLRNLKKIGLERKIPNISEENADFLKTLIRERNPKRILEIGTANGYSTLQFASVFLESSQSVNMPVFDQSITTIEYAWTAHIEAVEHFRNCKAKNIHAIW